MSEPALHEASETTPKGSFPWKGLGIGCGVVIVLGIAFFIWLFSHAMWA